MATAVESRSEKKDRRPSTAHLKVVPETRDLRDRVRLEAARFGQTLDRSKPLTKQALQKMAEDLLQRVRQYEQERVEIRARLARILARMGPAAP